VERIKSERRYTASPAGLVLSTEKSPPRALRLPPTPSVRAVLPGLRIEYRRASEMFWACRLKESMVRSPMIKLSFFIKEGYWVRSEKNSQIKNIFLIWESGVLEISVRHLGICWKSDCCGLSCHYFGFRKSGCCCSGSCLAMRSESCCLSENC
jgi:hypothetical protein